MARVGQEGRLQHNLCQTLHLARRTLHADAEINSRYLSVSGEQILMCPHGRLWVDVEAFEEASDTARRSGDPAAYRVAIELYSGELLPEDRYEEWAEDRRQGLRQRFLSLLVELAGLYEERGTDEDLAPAVQALQRALTEESTNEEAHVGLMRLYARSGRQGEALKQYVQLSETLSSELSVEPSASARALRDDIAGGRFPASPTQDAVPPAGPPTEETSGGGARAHNLPAQRTSFVGREQEMLELERALAMTRLLTLSGVGGSGKTRLALEVARDLVGAYPGGVWMVELAPLTEGALVPQICRKLEGMPLAVELAAARVGTLAVVQISERLEDSLKLLRGGRTAVPRQRTLRATLEWSYDLLSTEERILLGGLSAFVGSWTLEAAEAVGAGDPFQEGDVLELLSMLVDKSLVAEIRAADAVRYRLLEPVRQYARERLEQSGEADAFSRRHAEFFLALAEEAGAHQQEWAKRLEGEHDNMRAALSWSLERARDGPQAGRGAGALLGDAGPLRGGERVA